MKFLFRTPDGYVVVTGYHNEDMQEAAFAAAYNAKNLYAYADESYTEDEFREMYNRDYEFIMAFRGKICFLGEDLFAEP